MNPHTKVNKSFTIKYTLELSDVAHRIKEQCLHSQGLGFSKSTSFTTSTENILSLLFLQITTERLRCDVLTHALIYTTKGNGHVLRLHFCEVLTRHHVYTYSSFVLTSMGM